MRMIVDMSDLTNAVVILPTGQSGHAGHPHYIDMVDMWRLIEYVPMYWELDGLRGNTEGHLQLVP
jgi:acyl-homoserine lactone acylase PvdQ